MLGAIMLGYFTGTIAAFFLARKLLDAIATRWTRTPAQTKFMKITGGIFGTLALAPAIFISVILVGAIEGRYQGTLSTPDSHLSFGAVIFPAFGLAAVTLLTVLVATAMGAAMGVFAARSLYPASHT